MFHRFVDWLLSNQTRKILEESAFLKQQNGELFTKFSAMEQEQKELLEHIETLSKHLEESDRKRLTLEDLALKPSQFIVLRIASTEFRQALYDSLEHICLTELQECCRQTALRMKTYIMDLTLHPNKNNKIPRDRTEITEANERRAKLFSRHSL